MEAVAKLFGGKATDCAKAHCVVAAQDFTQADPVSVHRLIAWVDANCPYMGDEEIRAMPDPQFQGVDWLSVRPRLRTAPRIVRPGPID